MNYTTSTTSTVPDKYWDEQKEGYKDGFDWAVSKVNERFLAWLVFGFCLGSVVIYFINDGFFIFLSVLGLIYLVDKVKEIKIKSQEV